MTASSVLPIGGLPLLQYIGKINLINIGSLWIFLIILLAFISFLVIYYKTINPKSLFSHKVPKIIGIILIECFLGTIIASAVEKKQLQNSRQLFAIERLKEITYITEGTHGLSDYLSGDYVSAADSLKIYARTDAVAAYYYGRMLYDGTGVPVDVEQAMNYLEFSAEKKFYRAICLLQNHYARCAQNRKMEFYANEMIDLCRKQGTIPISVRPYWGKRDHLFDITKNSTVVYVKSGCAHKWRYLYNEQVPKLYTLYQESHHLLSTYYAYTNSANLWEVYRMNKKYYYGFFDDSEESSTTEELKVMMWREIAWEYWMMGKTWLARSIMNRISKNCEAQGSLECTIDYALMLLGISDANATIEASGTSSRKVIKAERILIEALKRASDENDDTEMIRAAKALENLYNTLKYMEEAAKISQLATGLEIKKYYEKLGI